MTPMRLDSHTAAPIAVKRRALRNAVRVPLPECGAGGVSQRAKDEYLFIKNAFSCDLCDLRLAMMARVAEPGLLCLGKVNLLVLRAGVSAAHPSDLTYRQAPC
jgi:hypothetical protein